MVPEKSNVLIANTRTSSPGTGVVRLSLARTKNARVRRENIHRLPSCTFARVRFAKSQRRRTETGDNRYDSCLTRRFPWISRAGCRPVTIINKFVSIPPPVVQTHVATVATAAVLTSGRCPVHLHVVIATCGREKRSSGAFRGIQTPW